MSEPLHITSRWSASSGGHPLNGIHGTPNTLFFQNYEKKKRVIGVEQSVPIKLCVIGVSGKSKSFLWLGYTETYGAIRCHLKNFGCFPYWNSFLPFFLSANGKHKKCFK